MVSRSTEKICCFQRTGTAKHSPMIRARYSIERGSRLRACAVGSDGPDVIQGRAANRGTPQTELQKALSPPKRWPSCPRNATSPISSRPRHSQRVAAGHAVHDQKVRLMPNWIERAPPVPKIGLGAAWSGVTQPQPKSLFAPPEGSLKPAPVPIPPGLAKLTWLRML
jgi:hypothetical protein